MKGPNWRDERGWAGVGRARRGEAYIYTDLAYQDENGTGSQNREEKKNRYDSSRLDMQLEIRIQAGEPRGAAAWGKRDGGFLPATMEKGGGRDSGPLPPPPVHPPSSILSTGQDT